MSKVIAETHPCSQAQEQRELPTIVTISSLYRRNNKFLHLETGVEYSLEEKEIRAADLWRYDHNYEIALTLAERRIYKRLRVLQTQPMLRLQHLGKWQYSPTDKTTPGEIASESINRRLNLLLEKPDNLIRPDSKIQQESFNIDPLKGTEHPGLTGRYYMGENRHLLCVRTQFSLSRLSRAARQLAKVRKGSHSKGKDSDWIELLRHEINPVKLLEAAIGSGNTAFLCALQSSNRLPELSTRTLERLKRARFRNNIHILGNLPPSGKLIFFLAELGDTVGLQRQISQRIPWDELALGVRDPKTSQSAMNFLGINLPSPTITATGSSDHLVRKNLADCAYRHSGGFNLMSPTVMALIEAGADIEQCLKYCPVGKGVGLKKLILQNFSNLRDCFHRELPEAVYQRLRQEPALAKMAHIKPEPIALSDVQLF